MKKLKKKQLKKKIKKTENVEKTIVRILKKIENELKLSKLTLELESYDFQKNGDSKEYQFLIENIKEIQDDLHSRKRMVCPRRKSMDTESLK